MNRKEKEDLRCIGTLQIEVRHPEENLNDQAGVMAMQGRLHIPTPESLIPLPNPVLFSKGNIGVTTLSSGEISAT